MRPRNYQAESGTSFSADVVSSIPTPQETPLYIGPPILGLNQREKRSSIQINETPLCKNARILRNYIEPRPRFTLLSDGFDSTIVYIREFGTSTGENYQLVITTKSLYISSDLTNYTRIAWPYSTGTAITDGTVNVVGSGTTWTENANAGDRFKINSIGTYVTIDSITDDTHLTLTSTYTASTGAYTIDRYFSGDSSNLFWGATLADVNYFVFSQGVDPVLYIDSNVNQVNRLSDDCPAASFGIQYADRLIIANIPSYPFRMKWCTSGNYTDWTGTGSGYKDWVEDQYDITGLSIIANILILYKTYSISHTTKTGRADVPFDFQTKVPGIGCYIPAMLISLGDMDMFAGSDNFYTYDLRTANPIGDSIKDNFINSLNPSALDSAHALVVEEYSEVQFYYPTADNTAPNRALVYNYDMDIWASEWENGGSDWPSYIHASGYATQETSPSWDSDSDIWDSDSIEWDSSTILAATPLNMISQSNGLYKQEPSSPISGADLEFEWCTKDFIPDKEIKSNSVYRVIVEYYGLTSCTLIFETSHNGGANWENFQSASCESSYPNRLSRVFFDLIMTEDVICGRFKINDGGRIQITSVRVETIPSGEVLGNG